VCAARLPPRRARAPGDDHRAPARGGGRAVSLLVQRSDVSEFRRRFRWIALMMAVAFLGLIARLFYLQIIEADENKAIARENIVRRVTLATTRGIIRDRSGKVLAASRPSYNIYV